MRFGDGGSLVFFVHTLCEKLLQIFWRNSKVSLIFCFYTLFYNSNLVANDLFNKKKQIDQTYVVTPYGKVQLTNLNPAINQWLLLSLEALKQPSSTIHIENPNPNLAITLQANGLTFSNTSTGLTKDCILWDENVNVWSTDFNAIPRTFLPICEGLAFIRLSKPSNTQATFTEAATSILRKFELGDYFIDLVKPHIVPLFSRISTWSSKLSKNAHKQTICSPK